MTTPLQKIVAELRHLAVVRAIMMRERTAFADEKKTTEWQTADMLEAQAAENEEAIARAKRAEAAQAPAKNALGIARAYIAATYDAEVGQEKHDAERDLDIVDDAIDALTTGEPINE